MGLIRPLALLGGALLFLGAAACRLPAREVRWEVSGPERTWLASLGEQRGGDLVVRLWVAERTMWPLPLPASRTLFFGDDDLFALILLDNGGSSEVRLEPSLIRMRAGRSDRVRGPARVSEGCARSAPPAGRAACGVDLAAWRGAETLELDLTDAILSSATRRVFVLNRRGSWIWRRVGPGVPGL
jgi:hypothetical protein